MARLDWDRLMGLGLGVLRLSPQAFWSMTPRELAAALRACGLGQAAPLPRSALEGLMALFPDGEMDDRPGNSRE